MSLPLSTSSKGQSAFNMAPTSISSRKRKTEEEMDESPPKRQTRARAAKATEDSTATGPKTTRITTASARIAAEAKAAASKSTSKPTTMVNRKTRITERTADTAAAPMTRTRTRKASNEPTLSVLKPSTREIKVKSSKKKTEEPPKTRARKVADSKTPTIPIVKRTMRARSATIEAEADIAAKESSVKKVVKRVTFQEDLVQDKENKPLPTTNKKETDKATGIKARPVRQPTKPRPTTRAKKTLNTIEEKVMPLSPRKITQIAKSTSSSEDELARTPAKKILKSPAKPNANVSSTPENVSQKATDSLAVENKMEDLLASPAKRPPPSPFKEALHKSPKKFPLPTMMPDLTKLDASNSNKEPLRMSPKKFDFTPARATVVSNRNIGDAARTALMGSPARRPASPLKFGSVRLPEKTGAPMSVTNTTSIMRHVKDNSLFSATPRRLFGSPTKSLGTTRSPSKVPELVADEKTEPVVAAEDPTISEAHKQTPFGFQKYSNPVRFAETDETFEHDVFEESGQYRAVDDVSDDELTLGPLTNSPSKGLLRNGRIATSPSAVAPTPRSTMKSLLTPKSRAKDHFMTPLAIQFGTWLATSPTRSEFEEDNSTEIYTPVAQVLHNRVESRRVTMTPSVQTSYFENQLPEVNVTSTPEDAMQDRDLHTDEDFEMVDSITTGIDVIAATPEDVLQQISSDSDMDVNMANQDEIDIVADSFVALPELSLLDTVTIDVENELLPEAAEYKELETIQQEDLGSIALLEDNAQEHAPKAIEEDCTVIVTRSESTTEANQDTIVSDLDHLQTDMSGTEDAEKMPTVEEYADENSAPMVLKVSEATVTINEALATPGRAIRTRSKEVRTVARVPLKPASNDTPTQIKFRKGRSKSMSTPLAELELADELLIPKRQVVEQIEELEQLQAPVQTPRSVSQPFSALSMPEDDIISLAGSPFKSVRKGSDAQILRGAVVHVDVHTSEGSDASGIFIELLTQMGAKCVKQWNWNSRSTLGGGEDPVVNNKVGITHVVFKDGSKRTLQKVREAKGLVLCVGVGWVLDCERANRWLEEAPFAVDTSTIPRGGRNRRKSMEPKMLANLGGNLVPAATPVKSTRKSLRLSNAQEASVPAPNECDETVLLPFTPIQASSYDAIGSPTTPFLVNEGAKLIQKTCPPKQTQPNLFPISGNIEDQPDERIRERLAKARRKTMEYAPKVGSPLGRDFPKHL